MAGFFVEFLHLFRPLRQLAKRVYRYKTIRQGFYGGKIYFNAVDFSFLWTNHASAEKHDQEIQNYLLHLSLDKELFVDIGANIGIMTLSVALRNQNISVRSYDPNLEILKYLKKSLDENHLTDRVQLVNKAISDYSGTAFMNFSKGSYAGHLSSHGTEVKVEHFNSLLEELSSKKTLFKLDVEGFETLLVPLLAIRQNPLHVFVIEMHPPGLNNISDPAKNIDTLLKSGFIVKTITDTIITNSSQVENWDNIVCSYA